MRASTPGGGLDASVVRFLHALARCEQPLVAGLQGVAVGVGTTLCLHCDYVVAAKDARFSTPFVQLGLLPEAASTLIAPRVMGHRRAFSLLVMGRPIDGVEAKTCGLAKVAVAAGDVDAEAQKAAREIAALPAEATALARRLMKGPSNEILARIDEESDHFSARLQSDEARAALQAFFARKR